MWKSKDFLPGDALVFQDLFVSAALFPEWALFQDFDAPASILRLILSPSASVVLGKDWEDCPHPEKLRLVSPVWDSQYGDPWKYFGFEKPPGF